MRKFFKKLFSNTDSYDRIANKQYSIAILANGGIRYSQL